MHNPGLARASKHYVASYMDNAFASFCAEFASATAVHAAGPIICCIAAGAVLETGTEPSMVSVRILSLVFAKSFMMLGPHAE